MKKKMYKSRFNVTVVAKSSGKVFVGGEWQKTPALKLVFNGQYCDITDETADKYGFKDSQELHDKLIKRLPGFGIDFEEVVISDAVIADLEKNLKKQGPPVVTSAKAIG